jgi:lysozyme
VLLRAHYPLILSRVLQQETALKWLQTQLSAKQLQDFSKIWRGGKSDKHLQLTDAFKYYKHTPQQDNALKWLQRSIPSKIMDEFLQQWT